MSSIFYKFIEELNGFIISGKGSDNGEQDLKYSFELQEKRLEDKSLKLKYEILTYADAITGRRDDKKWSDNRYACSMEYSECAWNRFFYRDGKEAYKDKQKAFLYEMITDVHDQDVVGDDPYICPNCGAVSKIGTLQNGCAYCDTHFQMMDLFPKVSNFFFVKQVGGRPEDIKAKVKKYVFTSMAICSVFSIVMNYVNDGNLILAILIGCISGGIFGGILGYILLSLSLFVQLFSEAGKSMPMLTSVMGSQKSFVEQMKVYSPIFSYEYFTNKVVALLKMIIFAEDATELPIYDGEPLGDMFSDIVETSYRGAVGLVDFRVKDDYCYVVVDAFMEDIYDTGRIKKQNDKFRIYLKKNISRPVNFHFSIKSIQCEKCGDSFDATKQRNCPSCGAEFKAVDADWVVNKIEKME